jgi:hypothetical protein
MATRTILVATSLRTAAGRQLIAGIRPSFVEPRSAGAAANARPSAPQDPAPAARQAPSREPMDARLHPAALGELIHVLGGRRVSLSNARVVAVVNPRAFLIESSGPLEPIVGNLDRLLVLVDAGALRVDAAALVRTSVRIAGVARTALGVQVTREVPWPPELTRDMVNRLEIRAVVLASSVQTSDGVELIRPAETP